MNFREAKEILLANRAMSQHLNRRQLRIPEGKPDTNWNYWLDGVGLDQHFVPKVDPATAVCCGVFTYWSGGPFHWCVRCRKVYDSP